MRTKIDWNVARADYIHNPKMTYQEVADKYGVSLKGVKRVGAKELWKEKRAKVAVRVDEKIIDQASEIVVNVNDRHTRTYKNMQALAMLELNIAIDNIRDAQENAMTNGTKLNFDDKAIMGQQRLKFLFDGLKIALDGERITLGLPTSVSVNKNEVSGADGNALFESVDMDELSSTIIKAVGKLAEEPTDADSA